MQGLREFFRILGYAMMGVILPLVIVGILYGVAKLFLYLMTD